MSKWPAAAAVKLSDEPGTPHCYQTLYAAKSWSRPRRIIARIKASTENGAHARFIVTNLTGRAAWRYKKVYCVRGRMENMIKEHKRYTQSDRTSCHRREANQCRLFLHTAACWLLWQHESRQSASERRHVIGEMIQGTVNKRIITLQRNPA